jgi:hypothetical protein
VESETGRRGFAHIHPEAVLPNAGAAFRYQGDTEGLAGSKALEDCIPLIMEHVCLLAVVAVVSFLWGRLAGHSAGYHEAVAQLQALEKDEEP